MFNDKTWNFDRLFPTLEDVEKTLTDTLDVIIGDYKSDYKNVFGYQYHIEDNGNNTKIYFEVAGIKKSDIKATIENNLLTVEVPKKKFYELKHAQNSKITFKMGSQVRTDVMQCKLEDGVLIISFDKAMDKQDTKKTIPID